MENHCPIIVKKNILIFFTLLFTIFLTTRTEVIGQTVLLSPTGDGGFETGTTFAANGWTEVQTNYAAEWQVGNVALYSGTRGAWVGTTTANNGIPSPSTPTVDHFYRDIAIPAGATNVSLSFFYKQPVIDNQYDWFYVFTTTTAYTPVVGTVLTTGYTQRWVNTAYTYTNWTAVTGIDLSSLAGTTVRLVFSFRCDGQPPDANPSIDYISLTYTSNSPCSGIPVPGNTISSSNPVCIGSNFTLSLQNSISGTGVTYQWQSSQDNSTWTNINGATSFTLNTSQSTATYYHCIITCSGNTGTSNSLFETMASTGLPWSENFDGLVSIGTNILPSCWLAQSTTGTPWASMNAGSISNNDPYSSPNYITCNFNPGTDKYLITPGFNLTSGTSYTFGFWWVGDGYSGWTADVRYNNTGQSGTGATLLSAFLASTTVTSATSYSQYSYVFTAPSSATYYFMVHVVNTNAPAYLGFDNFSLTVNSSIPATSASATPTTVCSGSPVTFSETGGTLGAGASWKWYTGGCPGTLAGSTVNTSLIQNPTTSGTYYVRAEGTSNTTSCVSTSIIVNTLSFSALYVATTPSATICSGSSVTLNETGGMLGSGASWNWYTGSCGGNSAGSSAIIYITPTASTTYYVNAAGTCNTTTCVNVAITVNALSISATSVISISPICSGGSSSLSVTGGSLGTGAIWDWYTGSCGGTYITSGIAPVLSPPTTTTYYVRAEETCNTTLCISTIVTVNILSSAPSSALAAPSVICPGATSTLYAAGGSLGTGANLLWYANSCGGTFVVSGNTPVISPTISTTYYVRAEGICNTTTCANANITINSIPIAATSAFGTSPICTGASATLGVSGGNLGSDASWNWYLGSCGGIYVLSGANPVLSPAATTTYFVRAESVCNNITNCVTANITVYSATPPPSAITATPLYICPGQATSLNATCIFGQIRWWDSPTGGNMLGTSVSGNNFIVIPTGNSSTIYYAEAFSACGASQRSGDTVDVGIPLSPYSVTATPSTILCPDSVNLNASTNSGIIGWFNVSSGGTPLGTSSNGTNFNVYSSSTTTYYAESQIWYSGLQFLTYSYTGSQQTFTVPSGVYSINVDAYGASGTQATGYSTGGNGGRVQASLTVTSGQILYLFIGGQGLGIIGGFNGGGNASIATYAGAGGGASDIRIGGSTLTNRVIVAGGGGGAGFYCGNNQDIGGTGGGLTGANGFYCNAYNSSFSGAGASQSAGGAGALTGGGAGTVGLGGVGGGWGGGGGGGYFGGGGGYMGGGGGGSNYENPFYTNGTAINTQGFQLGNGQIILSWNGIFCSSPSRTPVTITLSIIQNPTNSASPSTVGCGISSELNSTTSSGIIRWWDSSSGGNLLGTSQSGVNFAVMPSITTTYYSEAYTSGGCTSLRVPVTVYYDNTIGPTVNSPLPVCPGVSSILNATGGNQINWWDSQTGGSFIGSSLSGNNFLVNPTTTTIYYAEYTWNSPPCISGRIPVIATINNVSISAISANSYPATICPGTTSSLGFTGGSLGTGANWVWYTGSCGGTFVISGSSPELSPTVTTTYYLRAEGTCNTTGCISITIIVNALSIPATTATASSPICIGALSTFGLTGGSLGTEANWNWYTGYCGDIFVVSGASPVISPTVTDTYYVLAAGACNTTTCITVLINVIAVPIDPVSASANPGIISSGQTATLSVSGVLSAGAVWNWYLSSCGNGTDVGTGISIVVNPSGTTSYYVRAENGICYSNCSSIIVNIPGSLSGPTSVIAIPNPVCSGQVSTISLSGTLGGGQWCWYSMSCGGIFLGSGTDIIIAPTIATNYYARQELGNLFSNCASVLVNINNLSTPALMASGTSPICISTSTTLAVIGGNLGTLANWKWYSGLCGGTSIGSGVLIVTSPTVTANYFVRAEGQCNTTTCVNTIVTVNDSSISANSVIASPAAICINSSTTLDISGGLLGTSANWHWYSGTCGGIIVGYGQTIIVNPTVETSYFARAEGLCNTTSCESTTIFINTLSVSAVSATVSLSIICENASTTLMLTGGSLGTAGIWNWYSGTCGGIMIGSGLALTISPTINTDYFVRAEGLCNTTSCVNVIVTVNDSSISAGSATAIPASICINNSATLDITGGFIGTSANWHWYNGNCGGTATGNGQSIIVSPTIETEYFVRAEGICNTTNCVSIVLIVNSLSTSVISVDATSTTICKGDSTVISFIGGSLGTAGTWIWYSGTCDGTTIGDGVALTVKPVLTTDYFVRAEGTCNTTICVSVIVTVNDSSTLAVSAIAALSTICEGLSTTLSVSGGMLGTIADWYWYTGTCGGTEISNGASVIVSPTVTINYFVRVEGVCNTTPCVNLMITVNDSSISAGSATATLSTICEGDSTVLGITGGFSGTAAEWFWYSEGCGVNQIGNGAGLHVMPTVTTNYFVRAEGICNTTPCVDIVVTVSNNSEAANTITALPDTLCLGESTQLSINGGVLGTLAGWYWYSGSCGGIIEGNGNTLTVSPAFTTDYYVRAEGACNSTSCINITVTVNSPSIALTSISAVQDTIIKGNSTTLNIVGGLLGAGATWNWYTGSCSGNVAGQGDTLVINPMLTTSYFARGEGTCNTTACVNITITVHDSSTIATSVTATADTICSGSSIILGINGGSLGTNADWFWYSGSCGANLIGNGATLTVMPTVTTDYYVRAEGLLNTTTCIYQNIVVNTLTVLPTTITANMDTINIGVMDTLRISDGTLGTGGMWYWYSGSCGGTVLGSGEIFVMSPTITSDYFLRGEGICNTTANCLSKTIYIKPGYTVSGSLTYDNIYNTPLDSVWLYLNINGNTLDSTQTDINGLYQFNVVPSGVYTITATTKKPWQGVNSTDAVKVKRHFAGSEYFTSSLRLHAADVNLSMGINTTDAVKITRRFVGSDTSFVRGDWNFEKPFGGDTLNVSTTLNDTITVNENNLLQDFKGVCVGDVNGSNVPNAKSQAKIDFDYYYLKRLNSNETFEMPIKATIDINVGAISLILNYPKELVSIENVQLIINNNEKNNDELFYNVLGDEIRIGWFETEEGLNLKNNESFIIIKGKTTNNFKQGDEIRFKLKSDALCELADENGNPLDNVKLSTWSIKHINTSDIGELSNQIINDMIIYPNPAKDIINMHYSLKEDGFTKISLYNILGEKVIDIINNSQLKGLYNTEINLISIPSGIYTCKMISDDNCTIVKRLVISR